MTVHDAEVGRIIGYLILALVAALATWHNATCPREDRWF